MKLRHQLMLAPWATTLALLVAVAGAAWLLDHQAGANQRVRETAMQREHTANTARAAFAQQQALLYRSMAIAQSLDEKSLTTARQRLAADVDRATQGLSGVARGLAQGLTDPVAEGLVKDLAKAAWRFAKAADNALDMASVDVNTGVAALQSADTEFGKTSQVIDQLMRRVSELEAQAQQVERRRTLALALGLGGTGMVLALGLLVLAWRVQRSVLADVQRVADAAGQVAQGRLDDINTGDRRNDEIGALLQAQASMVRQLRQMVQQVRGAARAIENSSAEVASGNMDLSQRTEQAAGSLQQSASSMEQLTGSVRQSAESAGQANQLAANASSVAQRGGQVVAQVVATMQGISDSSRRIGDIIGTIDGIAFQTNILALNAAVEAARAGEQGRGFAVVAAEVRSLAQRSAAAAREIKALISASVDNVDSGARLVRDAGGTMDEIVAAVQRVSATIGEITSAAQQQSGGIALVNNAVADLDQMTQRNAALVEQSAAAAESLREQAQRLTGVVGTFAWQE